MSLSFNCPSCKAHMEVPDDLSGKSGQCPRCQHVFTIPSPKAPPLIPVGKAVPAAPTKVPPFDPWAKDARDEDRPRSRGGDRPRRARAAPSQPSGPTWPWLVGILGALVVGGLLFSAFLVLVSWRKHNFNDARNAIKQTQPQQPQFRNQRVTVGRFDGNRAVLNNGVFQVKAELNNDDEFDPTRPGCRRKRYEVELLPFRQYVIELDSQQFNSRVRIEHQNQFITEAGFPFQRNVIVQHMPQMNQTLTIYASSNEPANGQFTLTVREQHMLKPFHP